MQFQFYFTTTASILSLDHKLYTCLKLINDLERYDKEISKLSSKLVASESMSTLGRYAPQGSKTGKRSTWTDMSLINHQSYSCQFVIN